MSKIGHIRTVVGFLWEKWPVGVSISAMALAAAIFPIVTPSELTPVDKAKWIAGLGFLLVFELVIIFKERRIQNRSYLSQMERLENLRQASEAHNTAVMRQFMAINDPIGSLKRRSLDLSESILDFAYSRIQGKPPEPTYPYTYLSEPQAWDAFYKSQMKIFEGQRKSIEYSKETWEMFQGRFYQRAVNIRNEFASNGFADAALDTTLRPLLYTTAENAVRIIGERLGFLAEKCNTKTLDTL